MTFDGITTVKLWINRSVLQRIEQEAQRIDASPSVVIAAAMDAYDALSVTPAEDDESRDSPHPEEECTPDNLTQVGLLINKVEFIPQGIVDGHTPFATPPGVTVEAVYARRVYDSVDEKADDA